MPKNVCIFDDLDTSFGTLWWVREAEWTRTLRQYASARNRKSHPGLSLNEMTGPQLPHYVLMLHGRSDRQRDCVAVRGLKREDRERIAYFGQLGPVRIDARLFTRWTIALEHDDPSWTRNAAVIRNHDKPQLTPHEESELRRWWERKRARQHWWKEGR